MDNQQGSTARHRKPCSTSRGSLDGRGVWERMDTCICVAESLHCLPETITTLLIGYIPIQNKKDFKKKIECVLKSQELLHLEVMSRICDLQNHP